MNQLARVLGFGLLSALAERLPARAAMAVQIVLILVGSLLPLWPLSRGTIGLQDLLAYSALWLAMSVGTTLIRLLTMTRAGSAAQFWALHYAIMIGVLSLVTGIWAVILISLTGGGSWSTLLLTGLAMLLANAWALADGWFSRGGRTVAKLWQVLLPGYLRFVPVLLATVLGAVVILGEYDDYRFLVGACLVVALTVIDLTLAVLSYRRVLQPS
ncbi:DUF6498-containing protein [Micropruina sp.]|uniref:DUF6498-containing protein n=1 Tax=Micropruina sp. TaxID=2737536 RepID=UPI0039E33DD8